ncbi:MAG: FtsL-like putative cell division protein [Bacteroidota bacterium]
MSQKKQTNQPKRKEKAKAPRENRVARSLLDILNGNFLTREEVVRHLPYLLFLAFLSLIYIANGYLAEGSVRDINRLENELKERKSEYITTKSDLMYKSKQSELAKMMGEHNMDLKESSVPPKKIVVDKDRL